MEGNCLVSKVVFKSKVTRPLLIKVYLGLAGENGRPISITAAYHLNTRVVPIRQHLQVTILTKIYETKFSVIVK